MYRDGRACGHDSSRLFLASQLQQKIARQCSTTRLHSLPDHTQLLLLAPAVSVCPPIFVCLPATRCYRHLACFEHKSCSPPSLFPTTSDCGGLIFLLCLFSRTRPAPPSSSMDFRASDVGILETSFGHRRHPRPLATTAIALLDFPSRSHF